MTIKNQKLEQLEKYVEWERYIGNFPDDEPHIVEWAISEIERLRVELDKAHRLNRLKQ